VLAVGNSESMDGNLSGAIITGSGSLNPALALLQNSSSPLNFAIPPGFTPPVSSLTAVNGSQSLNIEGHTYRLKTAARQSPPQPT
jgi:type IV pilus assembly protein PilY1